MDLLVDLNFHQQQGLAIRYVVLSSLNPRLLFVVSLGGTGVLTKHEKSVWRIPELIGIGDAGEFKRYLDQIVLFLMKKSETKCSAGWTLRFQTNRSEQRFEIIVVIFDIFSLFNAMSKLKYFHQEWWFIVGTGEFRYFGTFLYFFGSIYKFWFCLGMAIRRWRWHSGDFVPYLPCLWQLINLFFFRWGIYRWLWAIQVIYLVFLLFRAIRNIFFC